jgi:3-hydroxy-9,10-secoandrosta-1,3,5(10)-triene-9,17-dione monooxygenase reductase component
MNTFDTKQFRNALGAFTTGVTVVTTRNGAGGGDVGLTANSFNSVSLEPPMVLWSLAKTSGSLQAFAEHAYFAVHVLSNRQESLSSRFAKRGIDKFEGLSVGRGHGDVPLLDGCSARFECRMAYRYDGGDHVIFVGEVLNFEHFGLPPLVFQSGAYALAVKKPAEYAAEEAAYLADSFGRNALTYLLGRAFHQLRHRLKPVLAEHGLNDVEHQVIGVLGAQDGRTLEELDALLTLTGQSVTATALAGLVERACVAIDGDGRVQLTPAGRQLNIELVAATKSIEDDALEGFDHGEVQVLTHLVRRFARASRIETPPLWKKQPAGA